VVGAGAGACAIGDSAGFGVSVGHSRQPISSSATAASTGQSQPGRMELLAETLESGVVCSLDARRALLICEGVT